MIQQTIQHHHSWIAKIIWWCMHNFGEITVGICFVTGVLYWSIRLFNNWIKDKFGEAIKDLDKQVNGE